MLVTRLGPSLMSRHLIFAQTYKAYYSHFQMLKPTSLPDLNTENSGNFLSSCFFVTNPYLSRKTVTNT